MNNRTTGIKTALLFLGAFALYFATRTPGLDEHDSVQFAMGIREFNLWKDQPHPPGYPLFIFLGWIGTKVFSIGPEVSMHLLSALGGALFIVAWFLIIRLQFGEPFAWWVTACLAVTPAVWMTATKTLTDSLAAGLISAEILAALYFFQRGRLAALLGASLFGAAATGVRPQLILVAVVILLTALRRRDATKKMSILALSLFVAGCLLWLLPTCYSQWRVNPEVSGWFGYAKLTYKQWHWRLDKPGVYVGAGDWSPQYLGTRMVYHFLGWFGLGFGFIQSLYVLVVGSAIALTGLISYISRVRKLGDQDFWKFHSAWALLHVAIIFISLSPAQRYYLIIFPLLLVALLRGLLHLRAPWSWIAPAFAALLLYIAVPAAIQNHREEPPATRLVKYLTEIYPPGQRNNVALLFAKVRRHADWYAPEFATIHNIPPARDLPQALAGATAVYTDDAKVPLPPGWYRVPLAVFARSPVIYWKHHYLELFLIDRRDHQ